MWFVVCWCLLLHLPFSLLALVTADFIIFTDYLKALGIFDETPENGLNIMKNFLDKNAANWTQFLRNKMVKSLL